MEYRKREQTLAGLLTLLKKAMRSFDTWEIQDLEDTFGLSRFYDYPALNEWLEAASVSLTKNEEERLEELRNELFMNVEFWNEEELKIL
ncbi:MAG: hypothetical protein AAB316_01605, partial [Bacteroidota bacterium]